MIQIIHQRHKCIGCNACVEAAPAHWVVPKKDGKSYLRKSVQKGEYFILRVPELEYEENLLAAQNCPVNIIRVRNEK